MSVTGIVVEYNPFHKGHLHHINATKELTGCSYIIAVMSGNFVQRGVPAMIDKWSRAKTALMNGVDLVIELPLIYSLSSAEFFSFGAVSLLNSLGVVDNICFGSECGDSKVLYDIANILSHEPDEYKEILKQKLQLGLAYPSARSKALLDYIGSYDVNFLSNFNIEEILSSSNNILGIEYCKSLIRLQSSIKPFSIQRQGSDYNSTYFESEFSSASSIRKHIKDTRNINGIENYVPKNTYDLLLSLFESNYTFSSEDLMLPYIKYKYMLYKDTIEQLPDVSEGIHNRIYKFLEDAESYEKLINSIKTKRYAYSRISRILCQFFIGFENFNTYELRKRKCPYARILGFNSNGLRLLKNIKKESLIPIYTKIPKDLDDILSLDIQGTRLYSLLNKNINPNSDYLISPIMFK
ncbi:nucleotidyltransferase [Clostridium sp. OS1-26]|uniref:nucleotidyltransferase n=1 Tax=Clostridium sp. OS1-26 TaxID=3070681 RepID=UPI0027E1F937|nr:nucleotidyltransferase [Clostridium sp. OS1-26]WML35125.1 nucleotidyltransferase [Clostridium sp. OS1-26]